MKILFLAKSPDATKYFRADMPAKYLNKAGHDARVMYLEEQPKAGQPHPVRTDDVEWADVLVCQRPVSEYALNVITQIKKKYPQLPVVGEYDDNYFEVPNWNQGYTYLAGMWEWCQKIPALFDGIIFSTESLREYFTQGAWSRGGMSPVRFTGPTAVIPNSMDFETIDGLTPLPPFLIDAPELNKTGNLQKAYQITSHDFAELHRDKVVVAWIGSAFHFQDIQQLTEGIRAVAKRDPRIVFLFVGYTQGNVVASLPINRLFLCGGKHPITEYYRMLKSFKIDISLAPLRACTFNAGKSNLKILEAMTFGWYPVCSDFDPYEDDLDPDAAQWEGEGYQPRHGSLVNMMNPLHWADAIVAAAQKVRDEKLKQQMIDDNSRYVRAEYSPELRVPMYLEFFEQMLAKKVR